MTSKSEVFDPELKEQAPPSDLHYLRAVDQALDVRAGKIQQEAFQQAVETLQGISWQNVFLTLARMRYEYMDYAELLKCSHGSTTLPFQSDL